MPGDRRRSSGNFGCYWEDRAAALLQRHGIEIISRGYRCRLGELDIVGTDGTGLIVAEVRARRHTRKGSASESIDFRKQQRIVLATRHFLMTYPSWHSKRIRFDVIAIDGIDRPNPSIRWLKNAFAAA